jgi:hypothetical protein
LVWFAAVSLLTEKLVGIYHVSAIPAWIHQIERGQLNTSLMPFVALVLLVPLLLIFAMLLFSFFILPIVTKSVASRVASDLEEKKGGSWLSRAWESLRASLLAITVLLVFSPLWSSSNVGAFIVSILMGTTCYRIFTYDALLCFASRIERQELIRLHRKNLYFMAAVFGFLGMAPGFLITMALTTDKFINIPIDLAFSIWSYAVVYVITASWFSHYCLTALKKLRKISSVCD